MRKIPRFNQNDFFNICNILDENNVPYESKGILVRISKYGGPPEYNFFVSNEYFLQAVNLIKEYFGLVDYDNILFSGKCPACNYDMVKNPECPDCGLFFNPNPAAGMEEHPFYIFIQQNNLY